MNYKKPAFWIVVAAIVSCIVVAVCFLTNPKTSASNDPSLPLDIQDPNVAQFVATVLEVHDTYLMVAPEGGSPLSYADQVEVSLGGLEIPPALQVGETVLVVYDGYVQEVYPPRISTAYRVERLYLNSGPVETIYGNVKTYFRNTNGTWQTGGRNYKYRHVLTGRIPNAAHDTTFVYLSNLEDITFDQAWKSAGFGNSTEDYFSIEDAVLVEWHDVIAGVGYWPFIDSILYDIDRDGKEETCTLTYGRTNGVFSFNFIVNGKTVPYILRGHYSLTFEVAENEKLRIRGERNVDPKEIIYFDIVMNNGQFFLECEKEGIFFQ